MNTISSIGAGTRIAAIIGIAAIFGLADALALPIEEFPSAAGGSAVGAPIPNALLPKQVHALEGRLTLYADYASVAGNSVPLYLVNRTDKSVEIDSQDGDIYIKLEHELPDRSWERAQAHIGSWCGNSYISVVLSPGQHFAFRGYMPQSGEKARVRFAAYGRSTLVSNEGSGFVMEKDIGDARMDIFGRRVSNSLEQWLDPQQQRYASSSPDPAREVAALRLLRTAGQNPYYQMAAAERAGKWEKDPKAPDAQRKGAKAIREILAETWSEKRDFGVLVERSLKALNSPDANTGQFGRLEDYPSLVWGTLGDLAVSGTFKDLEKWKSLIDFAIAHPTPENIRGVMGIVSVPRIADELLPDSFFEKHLFDSDDAVQSVCAQTLSRRMQWSQLAKLGWKLPPRGQIVVLCALARPGQDAINLGGTRGPDFDGEEKFWSHCLRTQPLEAGYWLRLGLVGDYNPFNRIVHDPIHDFLAAEADRAAQESGETKLGQNGVNFRLLVDFLASWNLEEDDAVFVKLLRHGGYEESEVSTSENKRFTRHTFGIREAAKRALLKRGKPVPSDLVVEQDIPL